MTKTQNSLFKRLKKESPRSAFVDLIGKQQQVVDGTGVGGQRALQLDLNLCRVGLHNRRGRSLAEECDRTSANGNQTC